MLPEVLLAIFTLQGQVTTDKPAVSIRLVLEDPKARNASIAETVVSEDGRYEFRGVSGRAYRLVAYVDGRKQDRRDIEIVCRPGALVTKDFHYGKLESTLILRFPAEDPDFVDVAELEGDYPKDVLRDYERAYEDYLSGNLPRAAQRLEAIVERAPRFYGAHARLGLIFQQSGCFSDAEVEYKRASELSPRSVQPLLNLASAQIRAARVVAALETLAKVLELRPGSAIAHCLVGAAKVQLDELEDAEKSFQRALELDGSMSAAQLLLANLYLRQKNWDGAIEQLKAYLEENPFAPDRGIVKKMLEDARQERN